MVDMVNESPMFQLFVDFIWTLAFSEYGAMTVFEALNDDLLIRALSIETFFSELGTTFSYVRNTIYLYAYYLLILKFVKKIFDVYALQTDGDSNADIFVLVTNFCKAMVISMMFTTIWSWGMDIALEFGTDLTAGIDVGIRESMFDTAKSLGESAPNTAVYIIMPIYTFLGGILELVQLYNGVELWIFRMFVPLACYGLLDADQGVYKQYMKLIIKSVLTIIIQIFLLNVGVLLISFVKLDNLGYAMLLMITAIMVLVFAFKTPRIFGEFLLQKQGGGGRVMQTVYMGSLLLRGVM